MTTSGQDRGIQIFKNPLLMGTLIFNVELSADYIIGETNLDVLLTVHLSIILVINQLNAQILFFYIISLLNASTCFEHNVLIIGRSKLYYTVSGIITPVGDRPVHRLREDCIQQSSLNLCTGRPPTGVMISDAV